MVNSYILPVAFPCLLGRATLRAYETPGSALTLGVYVDTCYAIDDDNTPVLFHGKEKEATCKWKERAVSGGIPYYQAAIEGRPNILISPGLVLVSHIEKAP